MSMKKMALIALASTALMAPAYASNAEIDQLTKEINALKAKVNELSKKSSAAPAAASSAPNVTTVKACEAQGDGFFVIPGTSTCLRLSGYARGDVKAYENINSTRTKPLTAYGSRVRLNVDARSSTELGVVRGFGRLNMDLSQTSNTTTATAKVGYAYATLGGLSAGVQDSAFVFFNKGNDLELITPDDNATPIAASYTLGLGNGVSVVAAVENPYVRQNTPASSGVTQFPEVVGALKLEQGALSAKLSAATHQNKGATSGDKQGYAVQGGLKYVVSPETAVTLQGTYADAAMSYLGYSKGTTNIGTDNGVITLASAVDYENANTIGETSHGWSALGSIAQKLGSGTLNLTGVYGRFDDRSPAASGGYSNNVEYTISQAEMSYVYKPFTGFAIQPAIAYQRVESETDKSGANTTDLNQYKGMLRVWREF